MFQLTRNNFPSHLVALLPTLGMEKNIVSGFKKTGLYPFDIAVIRATVGEIGRYPTPASPTFSPQKRKLREVLTEMQLNDEAIFRVLAAADREVRGVSIGYDIAKKFQEALLEVQPAKNDELKILV